MSLPVSQLKRADLATEIEQGRRVEVAQFEENHRTMQTMGELLKARVFGSTEWAVSLRKRMTDYSKNVQGGGSSLANSDSAGPRDRPPEPYDESRTGIPLRADQTAGDRKQEHGVAGDREAGPLARPTTVQGGGTALPVARAPEASHRPPESDPHPEHGVLRPAGGPEVDRSGLAVDETRQGGRLHTRYPDPAYPHDVFPCLDPDCTSCDEAVKRLLRDCGVLPKGSRTYADLTIEPIVGPLKIPTRWRRDESDV